MLKLQLKLLNNYENNHSIILKDKLFIVYPFFLIYCKGKSTLKVSFYFI
jgi:hypothetical protein